jgi:hypothetical protein
MGMIMNSRVKLVKVIQNYKSDIVFDGNEEKNSVFPANPVVKLVQG